MVRLTARQELVALLVVELVLVVVVMVLLVLGALLVLCLVELLVLVGLPPGQLGTVAGVVCPITPTSVSVADETPGIISRSALPTRVAVVMRLSIWPFNTKRGFG